MCSKIACALLRPASLVKGIGEMAGCLSESSEGFEVPPLSVCPSPLFQPRGLQGVSEVGHCQDPIVVNCVSTGESMNGVFILVWPVCHTRCALICAQALLFEVGYGWMILPPPLLFF